MSTMATAPVTTWPGSIEVPRIAVPRWTWLALVLAVGVLWLVTMEGGIVSQVVGGAPNFFHELFHDGRHLLGVPCH